MPSAWNFAGPHAADEDVAFPLGKAVTRVKRHTRHGNGRHPEHDRLLELFMRWSLRLPRSLVRTAEAHDGPAVVTPGLNDVDLVAPIWAILVLPDVTGTRMNRKAERRAVADRVNLGLVALATDERVIKRNATVVTNSQNFTAVIL